MTEITMNPTLKPTRPNRPTLRQLIGGGALSAMLFAQNAAAFTIADVPLFLPKSMEPNIALTLDDSTSMTRAYVPDALSSASGSRRAKSSYRNGLYYNPQTVYPRPVFVNADGTVTTMTSSFTSARINGYADGGTGRPSDRDTVNLGNAYRPTWTYDPSRNNNGQNFDDHPDRYSDLVAINGNTGRTTPGKAYYYVWRPSNSGCSTDIDDDDCYSIRIVGNQAGPADVNGDGLVNGEDEKLNFAIWYSFYRTRNLMTVAAASRAIADLPSTTRLTWQSLRQMPPSSQAAGLCPIKFDDLTSFACSGWTKPSPDTDVDNRIRGLTATHRNNFYRWLYTLPAPSSSPLNYTPLRTAMSRVGQYFSTSGVNSPYAQDPQVAVGTEFSCRPNFHILMTDGYWNSDQDTTSNFCSGSSCGNVDNTSRTLPDGKRYDTSLALTSIFRSSTSQSSGANNLADIAFHYWATDLRPDLANSLLPFRAERTGTDLEQYWNPKNDPASWQHLVTFTVGLGLSNTLTLTSPDRRWAGSTYAGTGYANLRAGKDSGGTAAYWPSTGTSSNWDENDTTTTLAQGRVYDLWHSAINGRGQSFSADTPKDLADALRAALNRILERNSAAAALATNSTRLATDTVLFQARFTSDLWTGALTALTLNTDGAVGSAKWEASVPAYGSRSIYTWNGSSGVEFKWSSLNSTLQTLVGDQDTLNYVRGDASKEKRNGGSFRDRAGPIGDIINSDPVYVYTQNFGYGAMSEGGYASFLTSKQSRAKMLYVGSNDGFLRGFDADTGVERFAYVPNAVLPRLKELTRPEYSHQFYVDGSPTSWDAYFNSGWKTVLTGTTGAGGRSVFALDVTNPSSFGAGSVLWEVNKDTVKRDGEDDPQYGARLGYTIGQVVVAKLNNGKWAAIFGNGYGSPSNQASLYVVDIASGKLIKRIDTGVGSAEKPNGLGTPTLHDLNGDDVYDVVYAPDMLGNVWKFSLTGSDAGYWKIPFDDSDTFPKGAPLFTARNGSGGVQPISARVELASPPAGKGGIIVVFGTGRFFAVGDNTDTTAQSFYGIWDNGSPVSGRGSLQVQTISTTSIDLRGVTADVRTVTSNTIDWSTKRGWYLDLPTSMERVIGTALVRDNRVIFTTLIPSIDPCEFGGSGWLMEVSATTGAELPYAVFDTSGDGLVDNTADKKASGVQIKVGMVKTPLAIDGSPVAAKFLSGTKGEIQLERNRTFGKPLGRESWREVQR
jgi:type IV pilus assembly protein PilY1